MDATLDPEARALLEELGRRSPPDRALSPDHARQVTRETFVVDGPPDPVGSVDEPAVPGPNGPLSLRVYGPEDDGPHPVLVYVHGGGWVKGDLDTHDEFCRFLTREADCLTVAVDYHRAPEHPFPAPLKDVTRALEWVAEHAGVYGGDTDRIAVGGDSAGGNLAAAASLVARDRDGPSLVHQLLLYPILDRALDTGSYRTHADDGLLTRANMQWYWEQYLADELDGHHPYASPLRARSLDGLPPATVVSTGFDPLRDENA